LKQLSELPEDEVIVDYCMYCSKPLKLEYKGRQCASCQTNRRRFERKLDIVEYLGNECSKCGYKKTVTALEVHHLDPSSKRFDISGSHTRKWSTLVEELENCVLLCSNCHREVEYGIISPRGSIGAVL
jgi:5-methylcytosine-specific restriction endonuclease McrA